MLLLGPWGLSEEKGMSKGSGVSPCWWASLQVPQLLSNHDYISSSNCSLSRDMFSCCVSSLEAEGRGRAQSKSCGLGAFGASRIELLCWKDKLAQEQMRPTEVTHRQRRATLLLWKRHKKQPPGFLLDDFLCAYAEPKRAGLGWKACCWPFSLLGAV